MKKIFIMVAVLCAGTIIALNSCSSSGKIGGQVEGDRYKTGGWIDDNTLRMTGSCAPTTGFTNRIARENAAKECAENYAKWRILGMLIGTKIEGASGMKNFEMTGIAISQEGSAVMKGVSCMEGTCDGEQNCEVVCQVTSKGLKQKVLAGGFKGN
jgi:hypothetical protein